MAKKIETRKRSSGGSEAMLESAAINVAALGFFLTGLLCAAFQFGGLIPAGIVLMMSVIAYYLFRALSDIVRLLKHSVGMPYSGQIAYGPETSVYKCGDCNAILRSGLKCDSCGAEIEYDE